MIPRFECYQRLSPLSLGLNGRESDFMDRVNFHWRPKGAEGTSITLVALAPSAGVVMKLQAGSEKAANAWEKFLNEYGFREEKPSQEEV